jgi:hypothetical protein
VLALAEAASSEADLPESTREFLDKIIGPAEWQSDVIEHWLRARDDWSSKTIEYHGRFECGRGGLGGARVSMLIPVAASRKGGRIMNAARAL